MARRPTSRSKRPVFDIRAFEESRCLSRAQVTQFIRHLNGVVSSTSADAAAFAEDTAWLPLRDAVAILVLLFTGLRRFELCGLTCGDVDLETRRITVVGKGKVRDFVPIIEQATVLLSRWLELKQRRGESIASDAPLFCATGIGQQGFMSLSTLHLRWKATLKAAGLSDHYGVHTTRHTSGLLAYAATGGDLGKTARFLRHRGTTVTARHYLHVDVDDLRRELSDMGMWQQEP